MLSKVITGETSQSLELLSFPQTSPSAAGSSVQAMGLQKSQEPQADPSREIALLQRELSQIQAHCAQVEDDAFARGRQHGQAEARTELQPVFERLNGSIAETVGLRSQLRRTAEKDVVKLSLAIAKRILHRELQMDESALRALARFAFERMSRAEHYNVLVHPRFAAAVEESLPRRQDISIRVEADPNCAPGTLVIRTEDGTVDASVESQLEEITKGLVDRIL